MHPVPDLIADLVERIVAVAHPRRIILFGSAARGEFGPDSDLDVLVIVPDGVNRLSTTEDIYLHLIGFASPVDVVVVSESDLAELKDNFSLVLFPATRQGREIYAA